MPMGRKGKKTGRSLLLWGVMAISLLTVTTTNAARYIVTRLVSPEPANSSGRSINNSGKATGSATFGTYSAGATKAFLYANHSTTTLLPGPSVTSYGTAINGGGQVAGYGPVSGAQHAILWNNGTPQDFGLLTGTTSSYAFGINDLGAVVGYSGSYPFVWQNGVMTRLGTATGTAYGINASGLVAGSSGNLPVIWDPLGNMTALSTGTGTAFRVNDSGQVVGRYYSGGNRGFLWENGGLQTLPLPTGASSTSAYSINGPGQTVGEGSFNVSPFTRALLWDSGTAFDLNTQIPSDSGWVLVRAWDINGSGQIVGDGVYNGKNQAFLLTPSGSPSTQAAVAGTTGCGGWYLSAVTVTLTATDHSGSGIKEIHYALDGAAEAVVGDVTATVPVSGDGAHTLLYYAVDYAGNIETANSLPVNLDGTTPSSAAAVSGTAGSNGWYKSPVNVQITGNDTPSGVASIKYRKKIGETWGSTVTAGNPAFVNFSTNGRYSIGYYATDRACNAETEKVIDVATDTVPPVTTYTASVPANANGWLNTDVTVTFTGTDNLSGVDFLTVNGANVPGSSIAYLLNAEGQSSFSYFGTDLAGVTEATRTVAFHIDKTAPAVGVSTTPAILVATSKSKLVPVTINGFATDSLSGIASLAITITDEYGKYNLTVPSFGSVVNLDTYKQRNDADGRLYTVQATATDLAGNQHTSVSYLRAQ